MFGNILLEDAINKTSIKELDLLPSGSVPFNSAELLGSKSMERLIETVIGMYDVVVFDSPPVLENRRC